MSESLDEICDQYTIDDCITDPSEHSEPTEPLEIDIDVVAGIFYSRSKTLFREVFNEVLAAQREQLAKKGITTEHCKVKVNMKQRKEVPEAERCIAIIKKTGAQCRNRHREGSDFCAIASHARGETIDRFDRSNDQEPPVSKTKYEPTQHSKPEVKTQEPKYVPREEIIEPLVMIEFNNKTFLEKDRRIYYPPLNYDPKSKRYIKELDLDLAGTRRRDGKIEWLDPTLQ